MTYLLRVPRADPTEKRAPSRSAGARSATVPVVVLATQPGPLMHSALGVARSLGRLGVPCYFVHRRRRTAVSASRFVAGTHQATYDEARPVDLVDRLLGFAARFTAGPVLIPIDDPGALFLADHATLLDAAYRFPVQDAALSRSLADKQRLHDLAVAHGVPTPATEVATAIEAAIAFVERVGFPVVVKAIDPIALYSRVASRAPSVALARSVDDLRAALAMAEHGPRVLLQEFIPGGPESVWMFNGYFDSAAKCRQGFTGQKLRQFRPDTGSTSLGTCRSNAEVDGLARAFLERLGYHGIVDMGFRYDARDSRYKLLDVNPRLGATFRLFVDRDGGDVVRMMYADLVGHPAQPAPVREGRRWVAEPYDAYTAAFYHRTGRLSLREWRRSYDGVEEAAWFDRRDPVPFVAMLGHSLLMQVPQLVGRRDPARVAPPEMLGNGRAEPPMVAAKTAVTTFFDEHADYWDRVYERGDVEGRVYQARHERALDLIDQLGRPPGARVLDVGAGSGALSCSLAERGFRVTAVDVALGMLDLVRRRAQPGAARDRLSVLGADVYGLPFQAGSFDVVVALGLIPWLSDPTAGLKEMARVLRPGGHLLLTADNRKRLTWRIDPRRAPILRPVRRAVRTRLAAVGLASAPASAADAEQHTLAELLTAVRSARLCTVVALTVGFGPFTVFGRSALPDAAGLAAHAWLQRLADAGVPGLRSWGGHHMLLCRRPESPQ